MSITFENGDHINFKGKLLDGQKYVKEGSLWVRMLVDDNPVGSVWTKPGDDGDDVWVIRQVFIKPEERGKKYSISLMREIIRILKLPANRKRAIVLYVDPMNEPAIKTYTKVGFKLIGERKLGTKYILETPAGGKRRVKKTLRNKSKRRTKFTL
jgi:ribosomal protein S18 acetylase RimI-like enzyme